MKLFALLLLLSFNLMAMDEEYDTSTEGYEPTYEESSYETNEEEYPYDSVDNSTYEEYPQ